jgi:hypothetical protein
MLFTNRLLIRTWNYLIFRFFNLFNFIRLIFATAADILANCYLFIFFWRFQLVIWILLLFGFNLQYLFICCYCWFLLLWFSSLLCYKVLKTLADNIGCIVCNTTNFSFGWMVNFLFEKFFDLILFDHFIFILLLCKAFFRFVIKCLIKSILHI